MRRITSFYPEYDRASLRGLKLSYRARSFGTQYTCSTSNISRPRFAFLPWSTSSGGRAVLSWTPDVMKAYIARFLTLAMATTSVRCVMTIDAGMDDMPCIFRRVREHLHYYMWSRAHVSTRQRIYGSELEKRPGKQTRNRGVKVFVG